MKRAQARFDGASEEATSHLAVFTCEGHVDAMSELNATAHSEHATHSAIWINAYCHAVPSRGLFTNIKQTRPKDFSAVLQAAASPRPILTLHTPYSCGIHAAACKHHMPIPALIYLAGQQATVDMSSASGL